MPSPIPPLEPPRRPAARLASPLPVPSLSRTGICMMPRILRAVRLHTHRRRRSRDGASASASQGRLEMRLTDPRVAKSRGRHGSRCLQRALLRVDRGWGRGLPQLGDQGRRIMVHVQRQGARVAWRNGPAKSFKGRRVGLQIVDDLCTSGRIAVDGSCPHRHTRALERKRGAGYRIAGQ